MNMHAHACKGSRAYAMFTFENKTALPAAANRAEFH